MNHALGGGDCRNAEEGPNAIKEEHEHHEHRGVASRSRATPKPLTTIKDQQRRAGGGQQGGRQAHASGGMLGTVRHKPRQQQSKHRHDAAEHGVAQQHPAIEAALPQRKR